LNAWEFAMTALTLRKPAVPADLPAIPIKNAVVFPIPNLPVPLSVGRDRTLKAIEAAAEEGGLIFVVTQHDPDEEEPGPADVYEVGTLARILRLNRAAEGASELLIEGISRARIERFVDTDPFFRVEIRVLTEDSASETEMDALARSLKEFATKVIQLTPRIPMKPSPWSRASTTPPTSPIWWPRSCASTPPKSSACSSSPTCAPASPRSSTTWPARRKSLKSRTISAPRCATASTSTSARSTCASSCGPSRRSSGEDEEEEGDDLEQRIEAAGMPPKPSRPR
jgi:Lon protease-like protein